MVSLPKIVVVLSCGLSLCLGLSNAAQGEPAPAPSDLMKTDAQSDRQGFQSDDDKQRNDKMGSNRTEGAKTIKGELLRIEGNNYFVKGQDGKEVRLHVDETTEKARNINIEPGDRIEAKVNDQNHALSILSDQAIQDRRNAKE